MTRKVLVVDDDEDIRESMVAFLTQEGYLVVGARGGHAALSHLTWAAVPDVILLDMVMPGLTGPQVRAELSKNPLLSTIPVVICSGDTVPASLRASVFGVLQKPFDLEGLFAMVKKASESRI